MHEIINVRFPDALGDTVIGTAVIQSLRQAFPESSIGAVAKHASLLTGLKEVDEVYDGKAGWAPDCEVDLSRYIETRNPLQALPYQHLLDHMLDVAEHQLSVTLPRDNLSPKINLTEEETSTALHMYAQYAGSKTLIWTQEKTSTPEKDWGGWKKVRKALPGCAFVDLGKPTIPPRMAVAIASWCPAGVVPDSFMLHGSQAVQAPNVMAVMMSSPSEVVCYPGQTVVDGTKDDAHENIIESLRAIVEQHGPPRGHGNSNRKASRFNYGA